MLNEIANNSSDYNVKKWIEENVKKITFITILVTGGFTVIHFIIVQTFCSFLYDDDMEKNHLENLDMEILFSFFCGLFTIAGILFLINSFETLTTNVLRVLLVLILIILLSIFTAITFGVIVLAFDYHSGVFSFLYFVGFTLIYLFSLFMYNIELKHKNK